MKKVCATGPGSAIPVVSKQPKKAKEYYEKAIATYAKITSDPLLPDKSAWAMNKIAEVYESHLHDTTLAVGIYQNVLKNYSKTRWVQFAQGALMRISQATTARDTTKSIPPSVSSNTTRKK